MPEIIKLRIIQRPVGIVITTKNRPAFKGRNGGFNYVCGFCDTILAEDVEKGEITNKVVKCYECWRFNEFR